MARLASSTVPVSDSLAKKKKAELADLESKVVAQQQALRRKEAELDELKTHLQEEEATLRNQMRDAGSREQRVDVGTLKGPLNISQVGREMASAIRRRQERRKATLRERLNKQKTTLDHAIAHNRSLRDEIEQRRHVRLHHLAALKIGGTQVERSTNDISDMIVSAQRAYAERESCDLRQTELRKDLASDGAQWETMIEDYDAEMEALDEECRQRERELEELEKDCAAAVAVGRRAEAEQERQLEHYASVRNRRLEYAHGLEQIFKTLHVATVSELVDAYTMTASKILSLWDKHGEQRRGPRSPIEVSPIETRRQEQDIEKLDGEIKSLQAQHGQFARPAAPEAAAPGAAGDAGASDDASVPVRLEKKEGCLGQLCEAVQQAFEEGPMLRDHHGLKGTGVSVNPHNLVAFLGLMESAAVRVARQHRAVLLSEQEVALDSAREGAESAEAAEESQLAAAQAEAHAAKRRPMLINPPSMEGFITRHQKSGESSEQVVGLGERRYGRKSLRSELMQQILGGVQTQMEKMHEEEILVKIGEKMRESSQSAHIDKTFRDNQIDSWLTKRRTVQSPRPGEASPTGTGSKPASPTRDSRQGAPGKEAAGKEAAGGGARAAGGHGRSAPLLSAGLQRGFDARTIGADIASCLPRTTLAPLPGRGGGKGGGASGPPPSHGRCCSSIAASASTPALHAYSGKGARGRGAAARDGGSPADAPAQQDIAELSQTLLQLQREREQIQELKQFAIAAGGMAAPSLGLKGGVLRNLPRAGGAEARSEGALHPLPTRLDPSAF